MASRAPTDSIRVLQDPAHAAAVNTPGRLAIPDNSSGEPPDFIMVVGFNTAVGEAVYYKPGDSTVTVDPGPSPVLGANAILVRREFGPDIVQTKGQTHVAYDGTTAGQLWVFALE